MEEYVPRGSTWQKDVCKVRLSGSITPRVMALLDGTMALMFSCTIAQSLPRATRACRKGMRLSSRLFKARKARRQLTLRKLPEVVVDGDRLPFSQLTLVYPRCVSRPVFVL